MRFLLVTAALLLGTVAPVAGQENPVDVPKTGSVAGVVVDEKSGARIARAVVILRRDQEGGIGEITGADGKFTLRDVDPGTYVLAVERDGYVVARGQSQTVNVQAGQITSDLQLKLLRTGAISGRVVDPDGDPISGVNVVVSATRAKKNSPSSNGYATTNDRGEYRVFHIAPGEAGDVATGSLKQCFWLQVCVGENGRMSTKSPNIRGVVFSTVAMAVSLALSYSAGPPRTRIFHFDYQVAIEKIPVGARHIDVWVPIPHEDAHQRITNLRVYAPYPSAMEQATDGNTMLHIGRDNPNEPFTVTFSLDAHRQDVPSRLPGGPRLERDEDPLELAQYLHPDRLVPLHPQIRARAREVVEKANAHTDVEMARAIYDHVVSTVKYDKSGKGAGRGDIDYVCEERRGNCADFDAIFIGYSRAVGIPARFAIGFPLPAQRGEGKIPEYHCWAEFYAKGIGWVPVDAAEAAEHPSNREYFFGAQDENRIELTKGRDLVLTPKQRGGELNYFIYPYAEVDGKEFDGVRYEVRYRDL